MADFSAIRSGLETRLKTIAGLRTSHVIPERVDPPLAFVAPAKGEVVSYLDTFDGGATWNLVIRLYVSRWDAPRAQDALDPYLATSGPLSIKAAVEADVSLGGVASSVTVMGASGYGVYTVGNVDYVGVEFLVRIWTDS